MLHHFPSRADLLVAVAQHIVEEQRRYRRERIEQMKTGLDRVRKAGEVTWEVQRQPGTIAMLELMLATRSDRDLKRRFQPFVQFYQEFRRMAARKTAENMQTDKIEAVEDMVRVHQAALRGLAIELMFMDDMPATERALRLLARYERAFMTHLGVGFPTREERRPEPERKVG
jgi:AcrR family transcriptional regulator